MTCSRPTKIYVHDTHMMATARSSDKTTNSVLHTGGINIPPATTQRHHHMRQFPRTASPARQHVDYHEDTVWRKYHQTKKKGNEQAQQDEIMHCRKYHKAHTIKTEACSGSSSCCITLLLSTNGPNQGLDNHVQVALQTTPYHDKLGF